MSVSLLEVRDYCPALVPVHVIKEEMLLQGGGEVNVFNYRLKGRMKMKKNMFTAK